MKHTFTALSLICVAPALVAQAPAGIVVAEPPVLEFRMLASGDYKYGDVSFDLDKEKERLRAWLDTDSQRENVLADPRRVQDFNALAAQRGGPLSVYLQWYPHVVRPAGEQGDRWGMAFTQLDQKYPVVPLFSRDALVRAPRNADDKLIELVAVNMHEESFSARDLDASAVRASKESSTGKPAILYGMSADKRQAYADWSQKHIGEPCAILIRGQLRAAPIFQGRIAGDGQIVGAFTEQEAADLARDIASAAKAGQAPGATVVAGEMDGPVPAGADPADIAAMQGAQAMLEAEKRLRDLIKAGKIKGIDKILTFDEISSWPYEDGLLGMPERVKKLNGAHVLMTGFMLPIDEVENIKEFLLVQSLWSCCYGQPPDINGIVRVVMKGDARIDYQFDPIKVTGTFKVEATLEDGYCVDIYQLEADSVEVIK